jgi:hypothetical protein
MNMVQRTREWDWGEGRGGKGKGRGLEEKEGGGKGEVWGPYNVKCSFTLYKNSRNITQW